MFDNSGMVVRGCNARCMPFGLGPVGGSIGMLAGRIGEADGDSGASILQERGLDAIDDGILVLEGSGGDVDGRTVDSEARFYLTVVKL